MVRLSYLDTEDMTLKVSALESFGSFMEKTQISYILDQWHQDIFHADSVEKHRLQILELHRELRFDWWTSQLEVVKASMLLEDADADALVGQAQDFLLKVSAMRDGIKKKREQKQQSKARLQGARVANNKK